MKAPGLKIRTNANGSKAAYWVAKQCSRHATGYPDQVRRLAGGEDTWPVQCQEYAADLKAWIAANVPLAARTRYRAALTPIEQHRLNGTMKGLGHVYILRDKDRVKIGFSTDPINRIATIQNTGGGSYRVVACVPGTFADEQRLHVQFGSLRLHGEWFRVDGELREFLRAPATNLRKAIEPAND
jgi:hypothetical protein